MLNFNNQDRKILLNPGPVTTTFTVKQALIVPDICHREHEFSLVIQEVRAGLLKIVHGSEDFSTVLFASSGTGALDAVISSVIPDGKKILIINNGTYGQRLVDIAKVYHLNCVELKIPFDKIPDPIQVSEHLKNDSEIYAVAMVHHETSSGLLNPLEQIAAVVEEHSRFLIVDAISSYAGIPIDVVANNIDFLIGTSNKCLQGMPGISFAVCNKQGLQACSSIKRNYYLDLFSQYKSLEKEQVFSFTAPVQIMYALRQAINEYFKESEHTRYQRYKENYMALIKGLKRLHFTFPIPEESWSYLLVLACFNKPFDFQKIHDELYSRGYTIYPTQLYPNALRLACIGDLSLGDINHFMEQFDLVLQSMGA
jgi:2-aminoethylphosphonate aminotransferase